MDRELGRILGEIGARTAAPGGGAAAAITATLAAALTEMAARFADDERRLARARELAARLTPLAQEDADAYAAYLAARGPEREEALQRAVDVPLTIAETAAEVHELAEDLYENGNPRLRGESLAARELSAAASRTAASLVLMNLHQAGDDPRAARARRLAAPGDA